MLVDAGIVVSARDALENNGHLHEDVDGNSNFHWDAFVIVAPLKDVVHLVTELVETYVQPF